MYQRWAVITSGTDEEGQLSDLVLAELSTVPNLELVERETLAKLAGEQALSGALSAEGSASRLKLGQMLRADALVLTKITGPQENRELQLTVVECKCGARLRVETLPWKAENLPALTEYVKQLVLEVRQRFANGVTQVYAVPNFVSQSLSHDYDPLQARYAQLIANALSLQPGVAVLEIAEARALGKELAIGDPELKRLVPAFIAGEFRVEPQPDKEATITLKVTVSSSGEKAAATLTSQAMPLSGTAKWLVETVTPAVLVHAGGGKPLTATEQVAALTERADTFSRLGSLETALPLRESVLLLDPNQHQMRLVAFHEYCRVAQYGADIADVEVQRAFLARRIEANFALLEHAEYLITNRAVSGATALDMIGTQGFIPAYNSEDVPQLLEKTPELKERLLALKRELHRFIDTCAAAMTGLPDRGNQADFARNWGIWVKCIATIPVNTLFLTADDMQFAQHVILDILHQEQVDFGLESQATQAFPDEAAFTRFCQAYLQSDKPVMPLYGRYLLLYRDYRKMNEQVQLGQKRWKDFRTELAGAQQRDDELIAQYAALPAELGWHQGDYPDYNGLHVLQNSIARAVHEANEGVVVAENPLQNGALRFEPVTLPWVPGERLRFIHCGEVEALVTSSVLFLHEKPGELRQLLTVQGLAEKTEILDVAWDGSVLWVAVRQYGMLAVTPEGEIACKVTKAEGLPDADHLVLHAISRGKVLAVGSFGLEERGWCAIVQWEGNVKEPVVRIFHEARRAVTPRETYNNTALQLDPTAGFTPTWLLPMTGADGRAVVLVGRSNHTLGMMSNFDLRPLQIDLDLLRVTTVDLNLPTQNPGTNDAHRAVVAKDSWVFGFGYNSLNSITQPWAVNLCKTNAQGHFLTQPIPLVNGGADDQEDLLVGQKVKVIGSAERVWQLLLPGPGHYLYYPGTTWWRIDPAARTGQRLTTKPLPNSFMTADFSVSRFYGLVYWIGGKCYRVTIDETKIPKAGE